MKTTKTGCALKIANNRKKRIDYNRFLFVRIEFSPKDFC